MNWILRFYFNTLVVVALFHGGINIYNVRTCCWYWHVPRHGTTRTTATCTWEHKINKILSCCLMLCLTCNSFYRKTNLLELWLNHSVITSNFVYSFKFFPKKNFCPWKLILFKWKNMHTSEGKLQQINPKCRDICR